MGLDSMDFIVHILSTYQLLLLIFIGHSPVLHSDRIYSSSSKIIDAQLCF